MSFVDVWGEYNKARDANQRQSLGALQQAQAVQGILAQQQALGERQRLATEDQQLRGLLEQSGGDPTLAMQSAIKTGNLKGALSLASLMEHQSKAKLNERRGIIDTSLEDPAIWKDPDRLAPLAGRAIGANHPGGASILQYAGRLREEKALQDYLASRQGAQSGIPGAIPGGMGAMPQPMQPQSTPMPSPPAMDANGQPVPATAGVPVQMANNEAEARRMLQGATGPMRVQLREQPQASAPLINTSTGGGGSQSPSRQELEDMALNPNKAVRELGRKLLADKLAADRALAKPAPAGQLTAVPDPANPGKYIWGPKKAGEAAPGPKGNDTSGELSKQAVDNIAIELLYDPKAAVGLNRDTKTKKLIENRRAEIMAEAGITSHDMASGRAGVKADTASLSKIVPQYDAVTAFENNTKKQGERLLALATKLDSETGMPIIDKWVRAGRQAVSGDVDVSNFNAQMTIYRTEAARILFNPNLTGVLTDNARHEAENMIKPGATPEQIIGAVKLLASDFDTRKVTMEAQINAIKNRLKGRMIGADSERANAPALLPGGVPVPGSQGAAPDLGKGLWK